MAGVINPLMYKSLLTVSHDLNDISDGIYHTANMDNPANVPSGTYNNIIIQITNNTRQDKIQLMYSINSQKWLTRCKSSGSEWISWKKFALED